MRNKIHLLNYILKHIDDVHTRVIILEMFIQEFGPIPNEYEAEVEKAVVGWEKESEQNKENASQTD